MAPRRVPQSVKAERCRFLENALGLPSGRGLGGCSGLAHAILQLRKQPLIWQCVKTHSTPVVHIKIAGT